MRTSLAMDLIRLTRPVDFLLFAAAVALGGWLAAGSVAALAPAAGRLAAAAMAGALVGLGANVVNDLYDIEIDRRNAPHRPLAAAKVTPRAARILWMALSGGGIAFGFLASVRHGVVALLAVLLLWAYAARLKRVAGLGHAVVGATLASALVYGALAVEASVSPAVGAAALLAFALVAAREVVKAIPDIEGDRAFGAATLPTVLGPRGAAGISVGVIAATIAALPLLVAAGYEAMVLAYVLPMAGLLLAAVWVLLSTDSLQRAGSLRWGVCASRASGLMKVALGAGVAALALGR